jgi:hypothetical protein
MDISFISQFVFYSEKPSVVATTVCKLKSFFSNKIAFF